MKRIDRETVQRVLDRADIVEVVSDFVTLKRRGANYIGLCPFHNERTPSFSVSKSKGICKCFSCGKGGSAVNFVMEIEQMTFNEAIRYLAKKYNIEIKEKELTDEERQRDSERENMLAVNDFAMHHFEHNLRETADGRDIGLAYFRERGITDKAIEKFRLGYALEGHTILFDAAIKKGYNSKYLVDTGLCMHTDDNKFYDRFRGRVIYPIFSISGKVLGFGGRTLRSDKKQAKYVNSPESIIYSKSNELYGLYQAKSSIAKKDKCILVEGYMDVISMSQSGIENIVASSGTSLTEGQIRLIHRFTENVTVIYDSDAAGIKASLRGIDMLLAEGLNIKVVLLPEGDDPDSFAQTHSTAEVEDYISNHETDFIRFKTRILLEGAENDPLKRSQVINEIVRTISVIPDRITRTVYIAECSRSLEIDDKILTLQVDKCISERLVTLKEKAVRENAHRQVDALENENPPTSDPSRPGATDAPYTPYSGRNFGQAKAKKTADNFEVKLIRPIEKEIVRYILRYGACLVDTEGSDGTVNKTMVADFVDDEFRYNDSSLQIPEYRHLMESCLQYLHDNWDSDFDRFNTESTARFNQEIQSGEETVRREAVNLEDIEKRSIIIRTQASEAYAAREQAFREFYLVKALTSSPDDEIRVLSNDLAIDTHKLSKVHSKYSKVELEKERLEELIPQALVGLSNARLFCRIQNLRDRLRTLRTDASLTPDRTMSEATAILAEIKELETRRSEYAKILGDRVVAPH